MKRNFLSLLLLSSMVLASCSDDAEEKSYTIYKEYIDTVNDASGDEKNIFIFTQSGCTHCKVIELYFDTYASEHEDVNIYELTIDQNKDKTYKDVTLGSATGGSGSDGLKTLDNRICKYVNETSMPTGTDKLLNPIYESDSYSYVSTPLIIWYIGNYEVQISNNIEYFLEKDETGTYTYESFEKFMEYPESIYNWSEEFDLTAFNVSTLNSTEDVDED